MLFFFLIVGLARQRRRRPGYLRSVMGEEQCDEVVRMLSLLP